MLIILEIQPAAPADMLNLLAQTIERAQAARDAAGASVRDATQRRIYSRLQLSKVQILDPPKPPLKRGALRMFPPLCRGGGTHGDRPG
jgi:hypothetical protein